MGNKLGRRKKVELTDYQVSDFVDRYNKNSTLTELGSEINVTAPTMAKYLRPHTTIRSAGRIKGKKISAR